MSGEGYLAVAYLVVLLAVLVYLVLHSLRLARLERELGELEHGGDRAADREREEVGAGR